MSACVFHTADQDSHLAHRLFLAWTRLSQQRLSWKVKHSACHLELGLEFPDRRKLQNPAVAIAIRHKNVPIL
jgi:hypothetical protein